MYLNKFSARKLNDKSLPRTVLVEGGNSGIPHSSCNSLSTKLFRITMYFFLIDIRIFLYQKIVFIVIKVANANLKEN